jgi:hypothetical protein
MTTLLFLLTLLGADLGHPVALERLGRLDHPPIREASGIVQSRRHPGIFWVHNDSGNPPALFAVRRDGSLVREYRVNVPNIDWEDVALDDKGRLYVGDIGNNNGFLRMRVVYQLDEPDPNDPTGSPLSVNTASYYHFPPDGRFDAEGLGIDRGRALIVAKTFDGRDARVYAIPFDPPAPLTKPALPEPMGTLQGFTFPVTGAALTEDGKRLAVCSLNALGVYERASQGAWKPLSLCSFRSDDQIEAIAWDGEDLILAGEGRGIFRVRAAAWKEARPTSPKPASTPSAHD